MDGRGLKHMQRTGSGGWFTASSLLCANYRRLFEPEFISIRLQPQMKKYRSLWGMSTTNHNILYFLCIPRISFANTGNRLWKARKPQKRRGPTAFNFAQNTVHRRLAAVSGLIQKPSPRHGQAQGVKPALLVARLCKMWRFGRNWQTQSVRPRQTHLNLTDRFPLPVL